MRNSAFIVGFSILALAVATPALAQDIDPDLQESWDYVQQSMPGASYDLLKAACDEGTLTIYNGTWSDAQRSAIDAFENRFPCITVEAFELGTGPRRERFLTETRAGNHIVDIVQDTDPGSLNEQADQGLLLNYTITNDAAFEPGNKKSGYWYPLRTGVIANAWNVDNVSPEEAKLLTTWEGMLDPRFKGRVGISDPSGGGSAFLPYYALYNMYGEEYMKRFAALEPRYFANLNQLGAAVASGDLDIAVATSETPLTTLFVAGAPIEWSVPDPGIGSPSGQAISAHAPHPNAAKLYQEYSFTEEGYGAFQKFAGPPARIGFKDQRDVAAESWYIYPSKFFEYDPAEVTASREELLGKFYEWFDVAR